MMARKTTHALAFPLVFASDWTISRAAWLKLSVALLSAAPALADPVLPQGGVVTSGSATVSQTNSNQLSITQNSGSAIVNWNSFSIGQGGHVNIQQPTASATLLNRVTGSTTSEIHGSLTANGTVHLVNPNGIFIGPDGRINAGSFAASTLNITDEDFLAGRLRYSGDGNSAAVENAGQITIGRGGYAALLAGKVKNSGLVTVPYGRIGFAAGERITLNLSGDQFLEVALPSDSLDDETEALIENDGTALATGGLIEMKAATARHAARHAINLSGVAEATSVHKHNGAIVLGGGDGGLVTVSGRVSTKAKPRIVMETSTRPQLRGGQIDITGARIALAGAEIDASGDAGGGLIRIGGDFAGEGDLLRADQVTGDAATAITADATVAGDGGRIVLWSELQTDMAGELSAVGGPDGGDGGFVEVSSRNVLNYTGLTDLRAPLGAWGTLLLDPTDITIDAGPDGENALEANLALGNVTLDTASAITSDTGVITINADVDWSSGTTLTLSADDSIGINGSIVATAGGDLVMTAPSFVDIGGPVDVDALTIITPDLSVFEGGVVTARAGGAITVDEFSLSSGSWTQIDPNLSTFVATTSFLIDPDATFIRALGGDGSAATPFQLTDVYGLQGLSTLPTANVTLANDIDASVTAGWEDDGMNVGFAPIPSFGATFDGGRQTITDLTIDAAQLQDDGGLFAELTSTATVQDVAIENATVTGVNAGVLAVRNLGVIENVRVSGSVSSSSSSQAQFDVAVGGFVAISGDPDLDPGTAEINDSIAEVDVTYDGNQGATIGGFVGWNGTGSTINRSHSTGNVVVTREEGAEVELNVGGFAGREGVTALDSPAPEFPIIILITESDVDVPIDQSQLFTINDSYATGDVTISDTSTFDGNVTNVFAGGFVGDMTDGNVNRSYSTGSVTTTGDAAFVVGGFSGSGGGGTGNFWDVTTSGNTTSNPTAAPAVATGLTTAQFQDTVTFFGLGTDAGWDFETVWAPGDDGRYPTNYTTSPVVLAVPDAFADIQYGLTPTATATGSVFGGPDLFVFDEPGDTLDTSPVFDALAFADENVGVTTFAITTATLESANDVTYTVVDLPNDATITPAPLTITPDDQSKLYGTTFTFDDTAFVATGEQFADQVTSVTLDSLGAPETADVAGSPYAITASDPVGIDLANYDITFEIGDLTVTPAPLTITALDQEPKLYGTTFTFTGDEFETTGLLFEDSIDSVTLQSDGAAADAGVAGSPYAIVASDAIGADAPNYDITFVTGQLSVTPRPLTIIATDQSKNEGTAFVFDGTEFVIAEDTQLLFDDNVASVSFSSLGAPASASADGSPYAIDASNAMGEGVDNYNISFVPGLLTVTETAEQPKTPGDFDDFPPPNPNDTLRIVLSGTDGGSTAELVAAQETLENVDGIADTLEARAASCAQSSGNTARYLACLSDALDDFADELDNIAEDLPPGLRNVARIVQDARVEIDAARSRAQSRLATATTDAERAAIRRDAFAESRAALDTASTEIRKAIALVRVDDPELANIQRATITRVATTIDNVGITLTRATGL